MSWPTFVLFADKVGLCDDRTCAVVKHLSNFRTLTPQTLSFMGMEFASIEHAFQGAKYLHTTRPELLSTFSINGVHGQLSGAKIKSARWARCHEESWSRTRPQCMGPTFA